MSWTNGLASILARMLAGSNSRRGMGPMMPIWLRVGVRKMGIAPVRISVQGAEIIRCKEYLESMRAEFKAEPEARNDAGKITRAAFSITGGLACAAVIRGDYLGLSALIELVNVHRPGKQQCRVPIDLLADAVDDLARFVIGVDDDFEKVLKAGK